MKTVTPHRNISLWIDTYDDIFSDFDPRPYSERNISDDFIYEVKRVISESEFMVDEFKLLIPEKERKKDLEQIIMARLHKFIKENLKTTGHLNFKAKQQGFTFIALGAGLILGAGYISFLKSAEFIHHVLRVLMEPAGWFLMWTGLDGLINTFRKNRPELSFYQKLAKSKIQFISTEQLASQT